MYNIPDTPCMPYMIICDICVHWAGVGGQCRHIWHTWSVWVYIYDYMCVCHIITIAIIVILLIIMCAVCTIVHTFLHDMIFYMNVFFIWRTLHEFS